MKKFYLLLLPFLLMATWSINAQINIVCIGNSITHGKYVAADLTHNTVIGDSLKEMSYRFWLWEKLDSAKINATMVGYNTKYFTQWGNVVTQKSRYTGHPFSNCHEAYYGVKSDGFIAGGWSNDGITAPDFDTRLANFNAPDVAIIHMGTNDAEATNADVDASEANIKTIITKLRAKNPNVTVLLARLITDWKKISARMSTIATATTTANSPVYCVDLATGFINDPGAAGTMTLDWVHPNTKGQKHMAQRFYNAFFEVAKNDHTKPSDPSGLTVSNIKTTSVDLSWTKSTDNMGVVGYNVYANDVLVASSVTTPFTLTGLSGNTTYIFKVEAVDANKNVSTNKAASGSITTPGGLDITITVNDGTSPIQGAVVNFAGTIKNTDATGKAIFLDQNPGSNTYQITKKGYKVLSGTFNLTKDTAKTFSLLPGSIITFIVKDGTKVTAGAKITFNAVAKTTDAAGKAVYSDYKPGSYSYTMTFSGYKTVTSNLTITGDTTINIALAPDCQITFIVNDGSTPLAGAEVMLNITKITTDNTGKAVFSNLKPGTFSYQVMLANYNTVSKTGVVIKDDTTFTISLVKEVSLEENGSEISVYPNPVQTHLNISNALGSMVQIHDMLGQNRLTISVTSSPAIIDMSSLEQGYYFIRIIKENKAIVKKILIQK